MQESQPEDTATTEPATAGADSRHVVRYLTAEESDDYIAIMDVLDNSVGDLSPADIDLQLRESGRIIDQSVIEARLRQLRDWGAVLEREGKSRAERVADLLMKNWRYTATQAGRQVQRFFRQFLQGAPQMREIPLTSLNQVVVALEEVAGSGVDDRDRLHMLINQIFTHHDQLDAALVGSEDRLSALADRFDLDQDDTGQLTDLVVNYAIRVAGVLRDGSARAHAALAVLTDRTPQLCAAAGQHAAESETLVTSNILAASRGGRPEDWDGLMRWFDPARGRAAAFRQRIIAAVPAMYANVQRHHTSSSATTTKETALALARACAHPDGGTRMFTAALGDHSWRKLGGVADEEELVRGATPWRVGPTIELPELLRAAGRSGTPGRASASRDDTEARAIAQAQRAQREQDRAAAIEEILATPTGQPLSEAAARLAYLVLNLTARGGRMLTLDGMRARWGQHQGLACTIVHGESPAGTCAIRAPGWKVLLPGRHAVYHEPGTTASLPPGLKPGAGARTEPGGFERAGAEPVLVLVSDQEGVA